MEEGPLKSRTLGRRRCLAGAGTSGGRTQWSWLILQVLGKLPAGFGCCYRKALLLPGWKRLAGALQADRKPAESKHLAVSLWRPLLADPSAYSTLARRHTNLTLTLINWESHLLHTTFFLSWLNQPIVLAFAPTSPLSLSVRALPAQPLKQSA